MISRTPSITGSVKATSIWKSEDTSTLFVSIRGTSCKADHLVNFNRNQKDPGSVFVSNRGFWFLSNINSYFKAFPGTKEQIYTHSGFLACAATLLPWLTEEVIRQVTADKSLKDVVFTGHSAGGAVAAMVFLHFVCHCPIECRSRPSHCMFHELTAFISIERKVLTHYIRSPACYFNKHH